MTDLGMKHRLVGAEQWPRIRIFRRPRRMPKIPAGQHVVCGLHRGGHEHLFVCRTLEHMQLLYDIYAAGKAADITWYRKPGVTVVALTS